MDSERENGEPLRASQHRPRLTTYRTSTSLTELLSSISRSQVPGQHGPVPAVLSPMDAVRVLDRPVMERL